MKRWSFVKRFMTNVKFDDFMKFARQFCNAVDSCYESPSVVTIILYKRIPRSLTRFDSSLFKKLRALNREGELAKVVGLENVTREMFDRAVNVQLKIRPKNGGRAPLHTFGALECKGTLNDRLVFYIQPDEVAETVSDLLLGEKKPSRIKFRIEDGLKSCHIVTRG